MHIIKRLYYTLDIISAYRIVFQNLWHILHICSVQIMPGSKAQTDTTHRTAPTILGCSTWEKN